MTTAAIYARKSTEQNGIADESKSVTRQVEHARAYASAKGWTVVDEYVYVDDAKDVFLLSAMNFAAEIEREKASQRVRDAMTRKARAGYVCGGKPFGYRTRYDHTADGLLSKSELWCSGVPGAVLCSILAACETR